MCRYTSKRPLMLPLSHPSFVGQVGCDRPGPPANLSHLWFVQMTPNTMPCVRRVYTHTHAPRKGHVFFQKRGITRREHPVPTKHGRKIAIKNKKQPPTFEGVEGKRKRCQTILGPRIWGQTEKRTQQIQTSPILFLRGKQNTLTKWRSGQRTRCECVRAVRVCVCKNFPPCLWLRVALPSLVLPSRVTWLLPVPTLVCLPLSCWHCEPELGLWPVLFAHYPCNTEVWTPPDYVSKSDINTLDWLWKLKLGPLWPCRNDERRKHSSIKACSTVCNLNVQVHVKASFHASPITSQLRWPGWMWQAWPPANLRPRVVCQVCINDSKHYALCKRGVHTHTPAPDRYCTASLSALWGLPDPNPMASSWALWGEPDPNRMSDRMAERMLDNLQNIRKYVRVNVRWNSK